MAYPTRIETNIARYDSKSGDFLYYKVQVKISPTLMRQRSFQTLELAQDFKDKCIADREALKKRKSEPVNVSITRQWGYRQWA